MRIEVSESPIYVVVEQPQFHVEAAPTIMSVVTEGLDVVVEAVSAPQLLVMASQESTTVRAEVEEIRIISVGEQGPPGAASNRVQTEQWAPSMTLLWSAFDTLRVTLEGATVFTFGGAVDAQRVVLELTQDATGGRLITLPANVRYSGQLGSVTLSTAPGLTDRMGFVYNEATETYDFMAFLRGF